MISFHLNRSTPLCASLILVWGGLSISCRGPQGPAGPDAQGLDVRPPTVVITSPAPLETIWDKLVLSASVVDNVTITAFYFTLNGSVQVGRISLVIPTPPYRVEIPGDLLRPGWQYITARAYDAAGNYAETPPRMVRLLLSRDLSDTLLLHRHHSAPHPPPHRWILPDTARTQSYFVRFTPAKPCSLAYAVIWLGGSLSDTSHAEISFWRGPLFPLRKETSYRLGHEDLDTALQPRRIPFNLTGKRWRDEFFIVISLPYPSPRDTLIIGGDDGLPDWNRSGGRDDLGWFKLSDRSPYPSNLMVDLYLYYFPSDTL